ncbi:hypothetical protein K488DRAFT_62148 [Vararia minispora EC-137]|uniref:Uncharacterized protein n=1 Tax=Vararia minispora EC-137 TaxID=1314806 RepID=A0ACB8Q634_9AGAM|nr:hypothetical protein K488DRAFT_62148 [Vararia minispora EC-137]
MHIPLSTKISQRLERRKGGGGRGSSGKSSSRSSSDSGSGCKSFPCRCLSIATSSTSFSTPHLVGGKSSASTYSDGGGKASKISSGQFAGRSMGGGSRASVYGTSMYGSGYPGESPSIRGVSDKGFPYYFYPVTWNTSPYPYYPPYLHTSGEYGGPTNSSRPGGPLMQAAFVSATTGTTLYFVADNSTVSSLLPIVLQNCSSTLVHLDNTTSSSTALPYDASNASSPLAEEAVQYFRASSAVLTLSGYNNTVALAANASAGAAPASFPSGADLALLSCLNYTIGQAILLVDAPKGMSVGDILKWVSFGVVILVGLIAGVLKTFCGCG